MGAFDVAASEDDTMQAPMLPPLPNDAWASDPDWSVLVLGSGYRAVHPADPVRDERVEAGVVDVMDMNYVESIDGPFGTVRFEGAEGIYSLRVFHVHPLQFCMGSGPYGSGLFNHAGSWWYMESYQDRDFGSDDDGLGGVVGYARPATPDEVMARRNHEFEPTDALEEETEGPEWEGRDTDGTFQFLDTVIRRGRGRAYRALELMVHNWPTDQFSSMSSCLWLSEIAMNGKSLLDLLASLQVALDGWGPGAFVDLDPTSPFAEATRRSVRMASRMLEEGPVGEPDRKTVEFLERMMPTSWESMMEDGNCPPVWIFSIRRAMALGGTMLDLVQAAAIKDGFPMPGTPWNALMRWNTIWSVMGGKDDEIGVGYLFGRDDIATDGNEVFLFGQDPRGAGCLITMNGMLDGIDGLGEMRLGHPCPLTPKEVDAALDAASGESGLLVGAVKVPDGEWSRFLVLGRNLEAIQAVE
jgi:hypothetical protein